MQQIIKRYFWIALLAASVRSGFGFSLLGPMLPDAGGEPWQVVTIGYEMAYNEEDIPGEPEWLGDIGGPHNIGEGYRRNVPILYYAYDPSFDAGDFFGDEGKVAIDGAFNILNAITNVDKYSAGLTEFPLTGEHYNYTAESLYLTDIKSVTLHLLVEQLGLADPARFSWTLHDRDPGTACPLTATYLVVQRNFDGVSDPSLQNLVYTPYVNNALLSYYITEHCSGPPPDLAITVVFATDPAGLQNIPVAANTAQNFEQYASLEEWHLPTVYGLELGGYYNGLTRDDVAGLRYLMTTNNAAVEPLSTNSFLFAISTNAPGSEVLFPSATATNNFSGTNGGFYAFDGTYGYGDYGWLIASSITNSPAALEAIYPGLVISSSTNYYVLATNWVYSQYYTNGGVGSTYSSNLFLVTVSNRVPYLLEKFVTTFANVVPDKVYPTTKVHRQTTTVGPDVGAPYGSPPVTNVTTHVLTLNIPSGDFFVLPIFGTNLCPLDLLRPGLTNVFAYTNVLAAANTNVVTATNTTGYSSSLADVTYFTNYTWVANPVSCTVETNAVEKYRGIGGVRFVRNDTYDYLTGQFIPPITNYTTMVFYNFTNHLWESHPVVRLINQPDILLAAQDYADGPGGINYVGTVLRNLTFNSSQEITGLHGPGIIDSPSVITYQRVGSVFENGPFTDKNSYLNPTEVNETTQYPLLQWASFDGSTNAPVVFPNTTSLENLENQVTVQLITSPSGAIDSSGALTAGSVNYGYSVQFSAVGGGFTAPFTWSATGVSGVADSGLPPGLSLSGTGLLSGTPTASGTYDFVLVLTDGEPRTVKWTLSITIN